MKRFVRSRDVRDCSSGSVGLGIYFCVLKDSGGSGLVAGTYSGDSGLDLQW